MWQPSTNSGGVSKHSGHATGVAVAETFVNIPQIVPNDPKALNLLNLHKLQLTEMLTTSPSVVNAPPSLSTLPDAAAAAAAAIYYNAAALLQNSPLTVMAHLQQYLKNVNNGVVAGGQPHSDTPKLNVNTNPWPMPIFPPKINNNDCHLLLGGTPALNNIPPPTTSSQQQQPLLPDSTLINSFASVMHTLPPPITPLSPTILDMLPMDILTDAFMRLNALHLSNSPMAVQHILQQQQQQPLNSSAASATGSGTDGQCCDEKMAIFMRHQNTTTNAAPNCITPILPSHLFNTYFHMDPQQQHLQQFVTTALNTKLTTSLTDTKKANNIPSTPSSPSLCQDGIYNYSSSALEAAIKAVSSSSSSSSSSPSSSFSFPPTNCDLKRAARKRTSDLLQLATSATNTSGGGGLRSTKSTTHHHLHHHHRREDDESLLPPPKKKWIRHYLKEDVENNSTNSLNTITNTTTNTTINNNNNNTTSYLLVNNSNNSTTNITTTTSSCKRSCSSICQNSSSNNQALHEQDEEDIDIEIDDGTVVKMQRQSESPQKSTTVGATTFTLIDSNGEIIGNASASNRTSVATKHMLLANGIRISTPTTAAAASTSTIVGVTPGGGGGGSSQLQQPQPQGNILSLNKAISIPMNAKNIPIIATPAGLSYHQHIQSHHTTSITNSQAINITGGGLKNHHHKQFTPLTPPPMASRKFVEPSQYRIRSFSMSSHKISANHHQHQQQQMHVQNSNGNSNCSSSNSMMVDDIPPTQQHNGYSSGQQQHSPPRQGGGNHYMHMMSQQSGAAGGSLHATHVTPRRRTISSTSNGAGTREVHNKLEKNRRAHLKECYEALKNQLSLKDEDRRKTSNLAILGEALKCVQTFQKRNHDLEAEWEHLANDKINLQKRIVSLKRELGPKYEQIFSGIFPDIEIGSIPSERDTINDSHSLSSGRGSTLYSSSSSLSSGGSNGSNSNGSSNAMSSPVGAGLQTAMPTAISPVITKINNTNISNNNNNNSSTSPININSNSNTMQRKHAISTTTLQTVTIPTQAVVGGSTATGQLLAGGGNNNSPTSLSPTTAASLITFGGSNSLPLSLTAKNISATAVTRGSPTPSTPSPSPSSSSGVSSSSSLISSSPPINGVINNNGRNVTVNIPNGLKLQAAAAAANGIGIVGGHATITNAAAAAIGNGTLIAASSAPAQGAANTNNAIMLQALRGCHLV